MRVYILDPECSARYISSQMLTSEEKKKVFKLEETLFCETANGLISVDQGVNLYVPHFGHEKILRVSDRRSPTLISIGDLCAREGYEWSRPGFKRRPEYKRPGGNLVGVDIEYTVPVLGVNADTGASFGDKTTADAVILLLVMLLVILLWVMLLIT